MAQSLVVLEGYHAKLSVTSLTKEKLHDHCDLLEEIACGPQYVQQERWTHAPTFEILR